MLCIEGPSVVSEVLSTASEAPFEALSSSFPITIELPIKFSKTSGAEETKQGFCDCRFLGGLLVIWKTLGTPGPTSAFLLPYN